MQVVISPYIRAKNCAKISFVAFLSCKELIYTAREENSDYEADVKLNDTDFDPTTKYMKKKLKALREKRNTLMDEMDGLLSACETDGEQRARYAETLARLPEIRISPATGRIMEWAEDYKEVDPRHRHTSHLFGLHPGNQITTTGTPALAEAARKTLDARGDDGTGWGSTRGTI